MTPLLDSLLVLILLLNFLALGTSRIRTVIQAVAAQGLVLGVTPLLVHQHLVFHVVLLSLATVAVKGLLIPGMLFRATRELPVKREVEPLIGLMPSLLVGALGTGAALALASRLPLAPGHPAGLLVPASLATVLTGAIILTTRLKAISQVLGYLVLENGIFIFGLLLLEPLPFLVEVGVLLDMFVGIFVMGIIINHIHREFASVDTQRLSALKE